MAPPFLVYSVTNATACPLHFVAFFTVTLYAKSILRIVAGTARFSLFHLRHGEVFCSRLEGEQFGVAVGAFIHAKVEFMAEFGISGFGLESNVTWFETGMAFFAVATGGKCIFAVVASAARFAFVHITHGEMLCSGFEWEDLGVAVFTAVNAGVESVAECCAADSLGFEGDILWCHSLVTLAAVTCYREGLCAVMAGAAGLSFFHLRHCYAAILAGDDFAVVAAFTFAAGFGNMHRMAEHGLGCTFNLVGNVARLAFMATDAVLFVGNAESLDAGVAGAA